MFLIRPIFKLQLWLDFEIQIKVHLHLAILNPTLQSSAFFKAEATNLRTHLSIFWGQNVKYTIKSEENKTTPKSHVQIDLKWIWTREYENYNVRFGRKKTFSMVITMTSCFLWYRVFSSTCHFIQWQKIVSAGKLNERMVTNLVKLRDISLTRRPLSSKGLVRLKKFSLLFRGWQKACWQKGLAPFFISPSRSRLVKSDTRFEL